MYIEVVFYIGGIVVTERKLARIVEIDEIHAIPEADAIECARIGGWPVVVKKDEFQVGDRALYIEIDAWVPEELAPFLFEGKEFNGVKGARLRTKKLRGQISQGLLLSMSTLAQHPKCPCIVSVGEDLTEVLGIQKWELPVDPQLRGLAKGNFPSFIIFRVIGSK